MAGYKVRDATVDDCGEILRLIKELAVFEKMADSVYMTVDILQKDGFGDNPIFKSLVVEELDSAGIVIPGKLLAYSIYYYIYSTWEGRCIYLEDLYVTLAQRKKGIGKAILKRLSQICLEEGCKRLQLAVLDWNTPAIEFYKKSGAINLTDVEGWHVYRFDLTNMEQLKQ